MEQNTRLEQETIVAISTPVGRGGIGIVRLSGPRAREIAAPMLRLRHELEPGRARFGELVEFEAGGVRVLDEVVVTYFAAPHSYTGEDVIEIAMHGAPVLLEHVVRQCCALNRSEIQVQGWPSRASLRSARFLRGGST